MKLNTDQVKRMRMSAFFLLDTILPFREGDDAWREVCKDYGGAGTTCGYLPHWLMWRLGVTDAKRINRTERGFTYMPGHNLRRIVQDYAPPFIRTHGAQVLQSGRRPECGDICYIYQMPDGPQNTEHVFCVLRQPYGSGAWDTAEAGQDHGRWGRKREDRMLLAGTDAKITGNTPARTLMGWLPLDELDYGPPPKALPFPFL